MSTARTASPHLAVISAFVLFLALSLTGFAGATPVVDQQNSVLPTGNFIAVRSGVTAAQTFTAGFAGTLKSVKVVIDPRGTPAQNLVLEVQATTGGAANGVILASAAVPPFGGVNPLVTFDVSAANLAVSAGQVLAFVLRSAATLGDDYLARIVPFNPYGGGQFTDSSGACANGAGWEGIFKTLVEPASVPGPGVADQSNLPAPTNNFSAVFSGRTARQTFTAGTTGTLTRIDVVVDPRNSPVLDLTLEVQATTAGVPNGTVLAAAHVAPFGGSNPTVTFDVSHYNLAVTAGQVLAFVLKSNAAGGTDYLCRIVPGNTYAGGEFTDSGGSTPPGWDGIFTTYVNAGSSAAALPPVAETITLRQNFPNPLRAVTTIGFVLTERAPVHLGIFDVAGRMLRLLAQDERNAGSHEVQWNGLDESGVRVPAGVYFYRLEAGGEEKTMRLVVAE